MSALIEYGRLFLEVVGALFIAGVFLAAALACTLPPVGKVR